MKCAVKRSPCSSRGGFKEYVVIVTLTCIKAILTGVQSKKTGTKTFESLG